MKLHTPEQRYSKITGLRLIVQIYSYNVRLQNNFSKMFIIKHLKYCSLPIHNKTSLCLA